MTYTTYSAAAPAAIPAAIPTAVRPSVVAQPAQSLTSTVRSIASSTGGARVISSGMPVPYTTGIVPTVTYSTVGGLPQGARVVSSSGAAPQYYIGQYSQAAYEQKHSALPEDTQLKNLKDIRKTCGLKHVLVSAGLKTLKAAAIDDKLAKDQFLAAYKDLLTNHEVEIPDQTVQDAVFDLFDRDDNGAVDMMELICGIALLCQGTEEEKIKAIFSIFDENGDDFISMDEMFKFLTSVFKVVLTPNVKGVMRSMGVEVESAEDLASVTSLECFKAADLNNDGKLSLQEFHNWFYAPKNDPSFLFSPVRKLLQ